MKIWMAFPIALSLMLINGREALAQSVQEFTQACQQDIVQHCPQAALQPQSLQSCLASKKNDLGAACKKIVESKK